MTSKKPDIHADGRYSTNETAALLGISRKTLGRYTASGLIKCGRWRTNNRPFYTGREILRLWMAQF